ncbi:MAG TPA: nitrate reductase formation protein NapD [Gammaproteobacteria bacterium]|nr:nitrate reductase formation protein NapD [Gammaproteobacteria bacterium]
MNVSGILVVVTPEHIDRSVEMLQDMEGIEVHYRDDNTGRIIITQEAEHIRDEVDGLKRIKALPNVVLAEMVYHCFEDDDELIEGIPPELDEQEGVDSVPPGLND